MSRSVQPVKLVVAGGFGVGKTTFVGAVSEVTPLRTEAAMTTAAVGIDDNSMVSTKTTTTVAMDFGRITVDESLVVYLFGTPGQDRFGFMWDDICSGALGACVLVDTRRIEQSFPAVDYFEAKGTPYVIGVNFFDGAPLHHLDEVREAMGIPWEIPMLAIDARSKESAKELLLALLGVLVARARKRTAARV